MKLGQNVGLYEISDEFVNGSCRVKNRSLGQMLQKPCVSSRGYIFSQIIMKLGKNFRLHEISEDENWSGLVKKKVTRSNYRIVEDPCL